MAAVELRVVEPADLEMLYEHQLDPEAATMAGFPSRDHDAFMSHWAGIMADPNVLLRAIVADGDLAGSIAAFPDVGKRAVGYWIGREFWGRGIATDALRRFLADFRERPLYAWVLATNAASIRVLEKCGFRPAVDAAVEPGELVFRLDI
jgi:RimJ/RimL family protein N-acetyltransferase